LDETNAYLGGRMNYSQGEAEQLLYRNHIRKPTAIRKHLASREEPKKMRGLGLVRNDENRGNIQSRIANIVKLRRDMKLRGSGFRAGAGFRVAA
jgi:hypothetical protein